MTIHQIEIEGLPDGWKPVAYRPPGGGEHFFNGMCVEKAEYDYGHTWLIVEKIQPRRIVLEETESYHMTRDMQLFKVYDKTTISIHSNKIWRQVKEGE